MSDDEMWWEPSKNLVAESSENEDEGSPVTDHDVSEQPAKKAKRQQKKEKKQKKGNKAKTDSDTLGTAEGDGDKKSAQAKRRAKKADKFAQKQRELRELYTSGAEGAREVLWNVITKDMSKTMTDLELEQVQLKAEHIVHADVKSRSKGRQLTAFCKAVTGTKKRLPHPKKKGDPPTLIVISVSAKRCVEVKPKIAAIAPSSVLKLFAKHMKQSEQEKALQRKVAAAVGTPARVMALAQAGALTFGEGCVVVIDASWTDAKKRCIFEHDDVRVALSQLLCRHILPATVKTGWPKIALF